MNSNDSSPVLAGEEFLSLVSHEIKNPLTSITGFADYAETALKNNDQHSVLESLEVVRSEARRILRLAEDLLDASCLKSGKFRLTIGEVDVAAVTSRVAGRYAATSSRAIDLASASHTPHIEGDAIRLTQVIENLVSNAIKYSPDGTPIAITLTSDGTYVRIAIRNQGTLIPPEKLALLFQRFSRLRMDSDGNGRRKGTGLGLYITRQIVKAHGGTITVTSNEQGTTFIVALPITTVYPPEPAN